MLDEKGSMNMKVWFALVFTLLILVPFVLAVRVGPNDFQWFINDPAPTIPPNYPQTRTTGYWVALEEDWPSWYSGATRQGRTSCTIPVPQRGFYEDVKCEGTGYTNDAKLISYSKIKKTREESERYFTDPASTLSTKRYRPPVRPKRTIATVLNRTSPCYIPRWSRVYIKFPDPNDPNTGWYVAEDTGGGFRGQYPYCKIDIFLGIGKQRPLGTNNPTVSMGKKSTWQTTSDGVQYNPAWPEVWVFPGERTMDLWADNLVTYLQGQPSTGRPPGQGGVSAVATSTSGITTSPTASTPAGYRPTHPYFTVPYSVNPSFSVQIPYDFSIYDTLPAQLNRLQRCRDDIDCIVNNVSLIEQEDTAFNWIIKQGGNVLSRDDDGLLEYPAWESYCEESDQHAVNSLAEAIDTCARSQDTDCVCNYTLPIVTSEDIDSWFGRAFSFGLMPFNPLLGLLSLAATELTSDDLWESRTMAFTKSGNTVRVFMREPNTPDPQVVRRTDFKEVHSDLRGDSRSELRYENEHDGEGDIISVYKDARGNISIYPVGEAPSETGCELHSKLVKFCIVQNKSFMAYNQQDNRMGLQQLVLKFAYLFKSEITDVTGFEVRDARFASNKSLLVWDEVPGVDVDKFTIYHSSNPAMAANLRGREPSSITEEERTELDPLELFTDAKQDINMVVTSLDSPLCEITATTCMTSFRLSTVLEDTSPVNLDDEMLYYSTVDKRFFYFLPGVNDGQNYFFGITATDADGEESPSFNTPVSGMNTPSSDDLPPGLGNIRNTYVVGSDVVIEIDPIDYNIDGSSMPPEQISRYKIYCFEQGASGEFDLSQKQALYASSVRTLDTGTVELTRPVSDFTTFACGFTTSPKVAQFVVAGVETRQASDISYDKNVTEYSFSVLPLAIPETA